MLADTAALRDLGAAQARHAAELEALRARLARASATLTSDGLGPVGARFLAAMCDAVHRDVRAAGVLGERATTCATAVRRTTAAYLAADTAAGRHLTAVVS